MQVFKTNTEFHRLASGPSSSEFVKIPWIFSFVASCLFMTLCPLLLLFLSANIASKDNFTSLVSLHLSPTSLYCCEERNCSNVFPIESHREGHPLLKVGILWCWGPDLLAHMSQVLFQMIERICCCECIRSNESQRGQPKPPHQGRALAKTLPESVFAFIWTDCGMNLDEFGSWLLKRCLTWISTFYRA